MAGFIGRFFVFMFFLWLAVPAQAEETAAPRSREQMQVSFAPLVKKAAPSVVNIYTKRVVRERVNPFFNDPFFNQFFGGQFGGGLLRERVQNALGSGVIVQSDGHVITNAHVIRGADDITVVLSDGREFVARLLLSDERTDLAVLKIDAKGELLPALETGDSDELEVGDLVLAIGNPFGVGQTVTSGIVSAVARTAASISDFNFFIQTDAAINPGNSGGALVDMDGRLVGINSAIFSKDGGSLGIGFAIPVSMVKTVLHASARGNHVTRPWAGVVTQRVAADMIEGLGLSRPQGALVKEIHPKSPALDAGLKLGDVVLAINGREVNDPEALRFRMATVDIGQEAVLDVWRRGRKVTVSFKAVVPPEDPPRDERTVKGYNPLSGARVANLSPAVVEELGERAWAESGVVILDAGNGGAARVGLQEGDVILSVNDVAVRSAKQLVDLLAHSRGVRWLVQFQRGQKVLNVMVNG